VYANGKLKHDLYISYITVLRTRLKLEVVPAARWSPWRLVRVYVNQRCRAIRAILIL